MINSLHHLLLVLIMMIFLFFFFLSVIFVSFFFFFKCEFCEFQGNRVKRHYFTFFIWKFVLQKFKGSHLSVTSRVSEGKLDMIETLISWLFLCPLQQNISFQKYYGYTGHLGYLCSWVTGSIDLDLWWWYWKNSQLQTMIMPYF